MRGFAQANSAQGAKNIVLVHGAWGWIVLVQVIALLEVKGFMWLRAESSDSLADDVARRSASSRCRTTLILSAIPTPAW